MITDDIHEFMNFNLLSDSLNIYSSEVIACIVIDRFVFELLHVCSLKHDRNFFEFLPLE